MHYSIFDYLLWLVTFFTQVGVLIALLRRELSRSYQYFFAYTLLQVGFTVVLAILLGTSYTAYYYAYYVDLGLSVLVSFAVIWEIFKTSYGPRRKPRRSGLFPILCLAVFVIAAGAMFLTTGWLHNAPAPFTKLRMTSDHGLRILQVGVLLLFVVLGTFAKAFRRALIFGIGLGFGVFAVVNIIVASALTSHSFTSAALSKINSAAYLVACVIWLLYAMYGSSNANGLGRLRLLTSLTHSRESSKPPRGWYRIGLSQGRTVIES